MEGGKWKGKGIGWHSKLDLGFRKFLAFDTTHCMSLFFSLLSFPSLRTFSQDRPFNLAEGMLGSLISLDFFV